MLTLRFQRVSSRWCDGLKGALEVSSADFGPFAGTGPIDANGPDRPPVQNASNGGSQPKGDQALELSSAKPVVQHRAFCRINVSSRVNSGCSQAADFAG